MWDAGIDWADTHHDAVVIDEAGRQAGTLRVMHTKAGLAALTSFLRALAKTADQMACLVETNQGLLLAARL